jgi:hypothetical protein
MKLEREVEAEAERFLRPAVPVDAEPYAKKKKQ